MGTQAFIPNTASLIDLVIQDIKESAFYIENSKMSLIFENIEASNISTNQNGGLIYFANNKDINMTNICCNSFDSPASGLFLYTVTPNTVQATFVSLDTSLSTQSQSSFYTSDSNITSLNISRVLYKFPGLYNFGTNQGKSYVTFHTIANSHSNYRFVDESTYGTQMWTNFNAVNCSSSDSIFKSFRSNTLLKNAVFAGNWRSSSNEKPIVIFREEGTLNLENVIVQSNGTLNGVPSSSSGFEYVRNPDTINMILANRLYCRGLVHVKKDCSNLNNKNIINLLLLILL